MKIANVSCQFEAPSSLAAVNFTPVEGEVMSCRKNRATPMEGTYLADQLTTAPMGWEDLRISSTVFHIKYMTLK